MDNKVVVERGLMAGELIVTEGYHKLAPGVLAIPAKKDDEMQTGE